MTRKINYSEKLKDPRWQKKRLEILQRDEWCCQACFDDKETLHVHHLYYEFGKEPWEYENNVLITLCSHCHEIESAERKQQEEQIINFFREHQFLSSGDPSIKSVIDFLKTMYKYGGFNWMTVFDILSWVFESREFRKIEKKYFNYISRENAKRDKEIQKNK